MFVMKRYWIIINLISMVTAAAIGGQVITFTKKDSLSKAKNIKHLQSNSKVIDTECGKVQGTTKTVTTDKNKTVVIHKYIGIPYAVPPIDKLRWQPPVRLSADKAKCWKGILTANKNRICKQFNYMRPDLPNVGQEDCLVLNVRTPTHNASAKLPVLIWIHGGALLYSQSEQSGYYPNSQFTASLNVVTVTLNYRLGPFGFLLVKELFKNDNNNKMSYGNYGLMDQILALEWVKRNIAKFGGDSNIITIYGQSAGAASVNALLASPLATGLFNKVISSSAVSNPIPYQEAMEYHRSFVYKSNCNKSTEAKIRSCLYSLSDNQVIADSPWTVSISKIFQGFVTFPNNSISNDRLAILYTDPNVYPTALPSKKANIEVLLSNTAQETAVFPPKFHGPNGFLFLMGVLKPRTESFSSNNLLYRALHIYPAISKTITAEYLYHTMTTDVLVTCDTNTYANKLSQKNIKVYRYVLIQTPSNPKGKLAHHTFDTYALFGFTDQYSRFLPHKSDNLLTRNLREIFIKFINTGTSRSGWGMHPKMTALFVNDTIVYRNGVYHSNQCKLWNENGLLGRAGRYQ